MRKMSATRARDEIFDAITMKAGDQKFYVPMMGNFDAYGACATMRVQALDGTVFNITIQREGE